MDPLSISAGIIAVATLAAQTCNCFADLRKICRRLPGRVHAVNNEVSDLELVLLQVASLVEERESCLPKSKQPPVQQLLQQATGKLTEVKTITDRLINVCRKSKFPLTAANTWRHEQDNLRELQEGIRSVKCSLNILLGTSNSQDMMQVRLDISNVCALTLQSSEDYRLMKDELTSSLVHVDNRIARVEEMLRVQSVQLQENQFKQDNQSYRAPASNEPCRDAPETRLPENSSRPGSVRFRVTPIAISCRQSCGCACHRQQRSSTPPVLQRLLGQLFIGYAGVPAFGQKCNISSCQNSQAKQISLEYWFPLGFLSDAIVRMQMGYQQSVGTFFCLDTLRQVPDSAQCVNFALTGDINGLKYLFSKGMASPRDISTTRGYSLLRWALYAKQYDTCQFLLSAGADPDYRPIAASDNSPRIKACHFLLEGGLPEDGIEALTAICKRDYLDEYVDASNFTLIHKAALGLLARDLEEEIIFQPQDIDAQDSMGRTALAWAAARGDRRSVVTLLKYCADPNITDVQRSGPLSNAASQGYTVCVRLLLDAGADPDPPVIRSPKKGSPLNCAARNATDPLLLKSLLDFGAEVDACGVDGQTSLTHAARTDNASFAMLLLEYGANINATSVTGATPLTTAITHNSHNVLRLVLDRWHEYASCPRLKGQHLLQIVALYADIETTNILAATDHFRLKYDQGYAAGDFQSCLRQRSDMTEKLGFAFDELLSVIRNVPDPRESKESTLEAGFLSCFTSPTDLLQNDVGQCSRESDGEDFMSCHSSPSGLSDTNSPNSTCGSSSDFRSSLEKPLVAV